MAPQKTCLGLPPVYSPCRKAVSFVNALGRNKPWEETPGEIFCDGLEKFRCSLLVPSSPVDEPDIIKFADLVPCDPLCRVM